MLRASRGSNSRIKSLCRGRSARPRRRPNKTERRNPDKSDGGEPKASEGATQLICKIELLPREAAIGLRPPAKMAIGCRPHVNRPVQAEVSANTARRQIHQLLQDARQLFLIDRPAGIDVER